MRMPLAPALRDADFSEAFEFTVVFEDEFVTQKKGRIYLDNIYFSDGEILTCSCGKPVQVREVLVYNAPPKVAFDAPNAVCVNELFSLDASATTDDNPECIEYFWNLGDGTKAKCVMHPMHCNSRYRHGRTRGHSLEIPPLDPFRNSAINRHVADNDNLHP